MNFKKHLGIMGSIASIMSFIFAIALVYYPKFVNIPIAKANAVGDMIFIIEKVPAYMIFLVIGVILLVVMFVRKRRK